MHQTEQLEIAGRSEAVVLRSFISDQCSLTICGVTVTRIIIYLENYDKYISFNTQNGTLHCCMLLGRCVPRKIDASFQAGAKLRNPARFGLGSITADFRGHKLAVKRSPRNTNPRESQSGSSFWTPANLQKTREDANGQ